MLRHLLKPALTPAAAPTVVERDLPLEGLRGLCALAVFYAHVFLPAAALDPAWVPSARFWYFNLGAPAVLMFFVLSGYVIGLVTTRPATAARARTYLVHRAARLVPLNTIAVLVSVLLLAHVSPRTLLGNLVFLENNEPYPLLGSFPLLFNNSNLWSLNFEVVYYLGFIALWFLAPPTKLVFAFLAVVVAAHAVGLPVSALTARYACGALYWLAGLAVAWHATPVPSAERRTNWPSALLGFVAVWQVAPLRALLYDWDLQGWLWMTTVSPHRLDLLATGVWVLLAVTGRAPGWRRALTWLCLGWTTAGLLLQAIRGEATELQGVAAALVAAAWLLARRECAPTALRRCAPLGAISFGFYVISSPLQLAQRSLCVGFAGSWATFATRAAVLTVVTLAAAYFLERTIGPLLGGALRRAAGVASSKKT